MAGSPFLHHYLQVGDAADQAADPETEALDAGSPPINTDILLLRYNQDTGVLVLWDPVANAYVTIPAGVVDSADVVFDGTASSLVATDVQAAIDEVVTLIGAGSYTNEMAQDAVGGMVDASLTYVDGTPLLQRAALTGDVTATAGSNATTIANNAVTFAKMQAITDLRVLGASGGTAVEELSLGTGLAFSGNSVVATGGGTGGSGSLYPSFTPPVDGDFAWINQEGASVTVNANGGIHLLTPAAATIDLRIRKQAAPATPYTVTACFLMNFVNVDSHHAGLCWRQSSDGKVINYEVHRGDTIVEDVMRCSDWTDHNNFSASNLSAQFVGPSLIWLRIADDGANRICSWSMDGYNFTQFFSEGRTTFLTADEVGFFVSTTSATWPASCTLLSWLEA